jgi:hypothetical protein
VHIGPLFSRSAISQPKLQGLSLSLNRKYKVCHQQFSKVSCATISFLLYQSSFRSGKKSPYRPTFSLCNKVSYIHLDEASTYPSSNLIWRVAGGPEKSARSSIVCAPDRSLSVAASLRIRYCNTRGSDLAGGTSFNYFEVSNRRYGRGALPVAATRWGLHQQDTPLNNKTPEMVARSVLVPGRNTS